MITGQLEHVWHKPFTKRMSAYLNNVESQFITECLVKTTKLPIRLIIDVSAGSGRFSIPLIHRGYRVLATDVNIEPLRKLAATEPKCMVCLVGSGEKVIPIHSEKVDCVICIEVPYVAETPWFWLECNRILRPGGVVVATLINKQSYKGFIRGLTSIRSRASGQKTPWSWSYEYVTSYKQINLMIAQAGLSIVRKRGFSWIPFKRHSDSKMIAWLAWVEARLGLQRLSSISPWVLVAAQKPWMCDVSSEGPRA